MLTDEERIQGLRHDHRTAQVMEHFKPKLDRIKDACSDDESWSDEYEAIGAEAKKACQKGK